MKKRTKLITYNGPRTSKELTTLLNSILGPKATRPTGEFITVSSDKLEEDK